MAQGFYELKVAKDGQFMFNLKAANGQVTEKGVESVINNASSAVIKEVTE